MSGPNRLCACSGLGNEALGGIATLKHSRGKKMAWTTPVIIEVCIGMEVTSYASAEI
jgi:coenzyme PQQ precursor peptide PqqA